MTSVIQLRRGTSAEWSTANPTLAEGEMGFITDTQGYKIGDGVTPWNSLTYLGASPTVSGIYLEQIDSPSTPPSGQLVIYAKEVAGRLLPAFKGPSGLDTTLQPSLATNGFYLVVPGTTTVMNVLGGPALTVVGTLSHPALNSTNLVTQTSRAQVVSSAAANSASEIRAAFARSWRGNASGLGGFLLRTRFAITSTVANSRFYAGLTSSTTATTTTQVPSDLTNIISLGYDSADSNFQIIHNDASGTATKVDLGSNFPRGVTDTIYELNLFCEPNGSVVKYKVIDLKNNYVAEGTISTDLPSSTTFLAPHIFLSNGGTASAVTMHVVRLYLESDY